MRPASHPRPAAETPAPGRPGIGLDVEDPLVAPALPDLEEEIGEVAAILSSDAGN